MKENNTNNERGLVPPLFVSFSSFATHLLTFFFFLPKNRYPNAIVDSRASLAYKKRYLSEDSEIIAEAHFKLSLALEFASVTTASEDSNNGNGAAAEGGQQQQQQPQQVDQELRDEAARELEAAIASTKLKLQSKEVELATLHSPEDNDSTRRQITEVKDIISDMEQRVGPAFSFFCSLSRSLLLSSPTSPPSPPALLDRVWSWDRFYFRLFRSFRSLILHTPPLLTAP